MKKADDRGAARLFALTSAQMDSLRENGIWSTAAPTDDKRSNGSALPIAFWAKMHGLTHQRANQLAALGIVVPLGRGMCDFAESQARYIVYLRDEKRRSATRGPAIHRDPNYYAMEARSLRLTDGAVTPGELSTLCSLMNVVLHEAMELIDDVTGEQSQKAKFGRSLGKLAAALTASADSAFEHAGYLMKCRKSV